MSNEIKRINELALEEENSSATFREKSILFALMAIVIILDYSTKLVVENNLNLNESWAPFASIDGIFQFTHVSNTGAAFGLFPNGSSLIMVIAVVVSLAIIFYNQQLPAKQKLFRVALGLQLGGALGNLVSRIRLGHVTDFLDFGPVPVFNLADTSIVTGVIILAFLMLLEERKERKSHVGENPGPEGAGSDSPDAKEDAGILWNE